MKTILICVRDWVELARLTVSMFVFRVVRGRDADHIDFIGSMVAMTFMTSEHYDLSMYDDETGYDWPSPEHAGGVYPVEGFDSEETYYQQRGRFRTKRQSFQDHGIDWSKSTHKKPPEFGPMVPWRKIKEEMEYWFAGS